MKEPSTVSPLWDQITGQSLAVSALIKAVESGRVSHCLMFVGPKGSGRRAAAKALAAALNCPRGGCGDCRVCNAISRELDPDTMIFEPEGRFISIEQARDILNEMSLTPFGSPNRIFIIDESEKLTIQAANALLKSLEEPHSNQHIVLIAESQEELPVTITSRAQIIRFLPVSEEELKGLLKDKFGLSDSLSGCYAKMACGSIDKAIDYSRSDWFARLREKVLSIPSFIGDCGPLAVYECVEELLNIAKEPLIEENRKVEKYKKEMGEILQDSKRYSRLVKVLDSRLKRVKDRLQREGILLILSILSSHYRDVMILKNAEFGEGKEDASQRVLINIDKVDDLKRSALSIGKEECEDILLSIADKQSQMEYNINVGLFLESILMSLQNRLSVKHL